jgi:hypothetical protein
MTSVRSGWECFGKHFALAMGGEILYAGNGPPVALFRAI